MNDSLALRWSILCAWGALCPSCGGSHTTASGFPGAADEPSSDAGSGSDDAAASSDGMAPGSGFVFMGGGDDGGSGAATDCMPGTYSGPFTTQVVVGDAGASPLSLMWTGTLTVTLVGQMKTTTGGEIPMTTLTIAPGGRMDGMDNFNGTFGADVTGQLDCSSKKLQATISNGLYLIESSDASTLPFAGTADGVYRASTPPALTGAIYIATTTQGVFGALGATGMVTATLQ